MATGEVTFKVAKTTAPQTATDSGATTKKTDSSVSADNAAIEVPYLDYERSEGRPFTAEYFNLGDTWDEPMGGYPKEIGVIEGYFEKKINEGEIANSSEAVKEELKKMLKFTGINKEERNVIKIETIAAYIKFLSTREEIKKNLRRYSNAR